MKYRKKQLTCAGSLVAALVFAANSFAMCSNDIVSNSPQLRFIFNNDSTVTDTRTNLRWQRCPTGFDLDINGTDTIFTDDTCSVIDAGDYVVWRGAFQAATDFNSGGGFGDWRVPNVKELLSIVEYKCAFPAVNTVVFPNTPDSRFWSATPYDLQSAVSVDFGVGKVLQNFKDDENYKAWVRLVRDE